MNGMTAIIGLVVTGTGATYAFSPLSLIHSILIIVYTFVPIGGTEYQIRRFVWYTDPRLPGTHGDVAPRGPEDESWERTTAIPQSTFLPYPVRAWVRMSNTDAYIVNSG